MSQHFSYPNFEDEISSTQDSDGEDYIPKRARCKRNTRRIHKIPLHQQEQLFTQVFNEGKQIKEVAQALQINYSSAKSLIHYYKNQKRSVPAAILEVLNGKKPTGFRVSQNIDKLSNNLKIEVRENNNLLHSYYYYQYLTEVQK